MYTIMVLPELCNMALLGNYRMHYSGGQFVRFLILLAILAFLSVCCTQVVPRPVNRSQAATNFALVYDATAALVSESGAYCAGVFYKNRVLTAAHCVDGSEIARVALYKQWDPETDSWPKTYIYSVAYVDSTTDMAVLNPRELTQGLHTNLTLADKAYLGQKVFLSGHPLGLHYTVSEGRVSTPRRYVEKRLVTMVTAEGYKGSSGGPCLNDDGEIIGITSFMYGGAPFLIGCVHLESVREGIDKAPAL